MAEGSIDRDAWAKVVTGLIAQETGTPAKPQGNKSRFAELVGVTYKTVLRWTQGASDVSEDSVRQVARALHISPLLLLVQVGYYTDEDLGAAASVATPAGIDKDDPALRVILEANVPPRVQQRMIQRLQELRAREAEREVDEVRWWIDQSRGA
ncbi:helix-turn-helix transcriptional regulator [Micromonospora sp. NPDC023633]|uniref:helix-turn-helix transcriptional regulator n=1 Tax=Micromonospora sp. NPDC023633 TaxID=3154320 RepID=UPI0033F89F74